MNPGTVVFLMRPTSLCLEGTHSLFNEGLKDVQILICQYIYPL